MDKAAAKGEPTKTQGWPPACQDFITSRKIVKMCEVSIASSNTNGTHLAQYTPRHPSLPIWSSRLTTATDLLSPYPGDQQSQQNQMAQGLIKKPSAKPAASSSSGITKKGTRSITPKKARLLKQNKINKKYTAGLTAKTEAMLGQRAGHLELLGQGRKKGSGAPADKPKTQGAAGATKKNKSGPKKS